MTIIQRHWPCSYNRIRIWWADKQNTRQSSSVQRANSKHLHIQRQFTKQLPSMDHLSYANQLRAVGFDTLEHRWLRQDLLHTYKVLFGKLSVNHIDIFCVRLHSIITGHQWKLYPNFHRTNLHNNFFCERVIHPWNSLEITNDDVAFKRLVKRSDLSEFMYFQ